LKLSKAPNMRTAIIALLAIFVIASGLTALGAEIKVTDTASLRACVSGNPIPGVSTSPDVGRTAGPGDTCVIFDGVYNVGGTPLVVSVENLIVRSMNGATATIIQGSYNGALISIIVRGVTFGGPAPDQGVTVTNTDANNGIALCVTDDRDNAFQTPCRVPRFNVDDIIPEDLGALPEPDTFVVTPTGAGGAQENITIQNNRFVNNGEEGVVFTYNTLTAIDTIRILRNEFRNNGGEGLVFGHGTGAIGRRGLDRNVAIEGNIFDRNVQANANNLFNNSFPPPPPGVPPACDALAPDVRQAAIRFCNSGTVEQVAILNNTILLTGGPQTVAATRADGILFDIGIIEIRDLLIDSNVIHQNTRNGIKFDYFGRLGENVVISNNAKGVQGITQNGPAPTLLPDEGNGIYITSRVSEVRGVQFVNNVINGNRGQYQLQQDTAGTPGAYLPSDDDGDGFRYKPCRDGNGISIEASGRVEDVLFDGNDFRQNFNNGVCIANRGDFTRSTVTNNKFHNNGFGEPIAAGAARQAPYGDGFGVYHDFTVVNPGIAASTLPSIDGFRIENITFSGNDYRENGRFYQQFDIDGVLDGGPGGTYFGFGFCVFLRTERQEISRISFTNEVCKKNRLGGYRLETDTDSTGVRSGDIREITWTNVQVIESQGDPTQGGIGPNGALPPTVEVNDNGDGIAHITDNGDISNIKVTNVDASNNGGAGLRLESDATGKNVATDIGDPASLTRAGDIDQVAIKDSAFNFNGDRAALGSGNGISIRTAVDGSIRNVTIDPTEASSNNDHGAFVSASRNVSNVLVENSTFNNNDRNRDTVGDGVQVTANEDLSQITVRGTTANSNYGGIRVGAAGRQIAQNVLVENCTANDNVKEGVSLFAGRDLISGTVKNSKFSGNGIGVYIEAVQRGTDLSVTDNKIVGRNGTGVGIQLKATNTTISKNDIRNNETGILVQKAAGSKANNNNIARNEKFGVDASALAPGEEFDATNNWWGEPSGPKAADNPGGIGDRVSQKVKYRPFLGEPAVPTETDFVVESLTASKTDVTVGDSVTFSYTIKNNGTEEGTQEVTVVIRDGLGNVVNQSSRQITVNPAGSRQENFSFIFQTPGTYTVTVTAQPSGSTKSVTVSVAGTAACLPFALDNNPRNQKIDDAEIITAIDLWVRGGAVPGCSPPVTISDTQIIQLIDLWVKQAQLTVPLGGKMTSQSATLSVASTFATLGASVRAVRPGESFTVTVSVDAKDGISGLLLSQALPAGWSAKPIQLSGAYYKASENKWLWLNAKGTVSVSYEVTVPATAQPGLYTIAGRVKAAVPGIEAELQPLTIEVLGAPVALAVKAITLSQQPVRTGGAYFIVEGVGIAQTTVRVFSLTGKLVFSQTAQGNVVPFSAAAELANGVYLYVVTVQGADGQTVTSKISKLVVLR
jgi:parallel beta-helix repeat protein